VFKKLALVTTLGLFAIALASPSQAQLSRFTQIAPGAVTEINAGAATQINAGAATPQVVKKAMTWKSRSVAVVSNGKTYIHVGSDNQTDPYSGDTDVNEARSLLCIRKSPDFDQIITNS
jgi:hypothetical protein